MSETTDKVAPEIQDLLDFAAEHGPSGLLTGGKLFREPEPAQVRKISEQRADAAEQILSELDRTTKLTGRRCYPLIRVYDFQGNRVITERLEPDFDERAGFGSVGGYIYSTANAFYVGNGYVLVSDGEYYPSARVEVDGEPAVEFIQEETGLKIDEDEAERRFLEDFPEIVATRPDWAEKTYVSAPEPPHERLSDEQNSWRALGSIEYARNFGSCCVSQTVTIDPITRQIEYGKPDLYADDIRGLSLQDTKARLRDLTAAVELLDRLSKDN